MQATQIEPIADTLLPQFIPKDPEARTLTFHFTMVPDTTYRVTYTKQLVNKKEVWKMTECEEVEKKP